VDTPPAGPGWFHEIKLDGYRALLRVDHGQTRVFTRGGLDWTDRFPTIAAAAAALPADTALLDGEIVCLDADGRSNFSGLVTALRDGRPDRLTCFVFDLLHLDGLDLREQALGARKERLARLITHDRSPLRNLTHVAGGGPAFHRAVCALGLEGTVSKRSDAPYRAGRTHAWTKTRCGRRQEMVIVGWTDPAGSRTGFGALLLAVRVGSGWRYAGRVGAGFDEATLAGLLARLTPLAIPHPPVLNPPAGRDLHGVHWAEPALVCEVRFTEWSPDGRLRHPVFLGLREDKPASEVVREEGGPTDTRPRTSRDTADRVGGVALSNPDRVFWPDVGGTKRDLARWLDTVADRMLPELAGRPLTLVRCPDGQGTTCFFQRHHAPGLPASTRSVHVPGHGKGRAYVYVESHDALVGLAQVGVLEIHPWGVRVGDLDRPDRLVFDLDPGDGVDWPELVCAATDIRARLGALGLASFARLTGGKGLHVVVPLRPHASWDAARPFCRAFAESLARAAPARFTSKSAKDQRPGRIYLDWQRNAPGATAIASWSTRARPGAPIAVPVQWEALGGCGRGDRFTLPGCLADLPPDAWGLLDDVDQRLDADVIRRLGRG
jgi:bifunctional non-homologous end joining protein LigD